MKTLSVRLQLICLGITLTLLTAALVAFQNVSWTDYVLMGIAAFELIQLICTLVRIRKQVRT